MTYLNSRPDNIDNQDTTGFSDEDIAALPFVFQMLVNMALYFFAKCARSRSREPRTALMFTLGALMYLHGGTREEKRAFIKRLFAESEARLDELYEKYRIWRQRKCWMWGGGFRAGVLANIATVFKGAHDLASFDALIPD